MTIRMLVGLGNPGPEYEATRHNAGFWWLDAVAAKLGARLAFDRSYHGLLARVTRPGGPLWLVEPQTYMNLSGKSVAALARFFKIEPGEILVAHDELDLLPGQVKLKQGGSHAGHNGLKDIVAQFGNADFWRLRLGIGHPGVKAEVIHYVLKKPSPEHREAIDHCIERSLASLDLLLAGEMERAMMKVHSKPPRPKTAPSATPAVREGETPCKDGYEVDAADKRSAEQRKAAKDAVKREQRMTETMTREPLANEAAAAKQAPTIIIANPSAAKPDASAASPAKKHKKPVKPATQP